VIDHIDLGNEGSQSTCKFKWPLYSHALLRTTDEDLLPDTILVDGLFRGACIMASLLYAAEDAVILFHDNIDERSEELHVAVSSVTEVVDSVDKLVVLRRKAGVLDEKIQRLLYKYWFQP